MALPDWKKLFSGGRLYFWAVLNFATALDQITKYVYATAQPHSYRTVLIPGILNFIPSLNPKGAFSFGPDGAVFYIVASFLGMALILWFLATTPPSHRLTCVALGCLGAGALGNLIDRLMLGAVRDFVDLHWGRYHWPTFNVADMAICVGVALLMWEAFVGKTEEDEEGTPVSSSEQPAG
jgi:signal peptidase II